MTSKEVISKNIKKLRAKLSLTKDDLPKNDDKVESGAVNKPSVQTMAKIAKALNITVYELIK